MDNANKSTSETIRTTDTMRQKAKLCSLLCICILKLFKRCKKNTIRTSIVCEKTYLYFYANLRSRYVF